MKTLISIFIIASAFSIGITNANEIRSVGQAVTACKTHAKAEHENSLRVKSYNIRQGRQGYKVNLKVSLPDSSFKSVCNIDRDGNLNYVVK